MAQLRVSVERDLKEHVDRRNWAGFGFLKFGRWQWVFGGGLLASLAVVASLLGPAPQQQPAMLLDLASSEAETEGPASPTAEAERTALAPMEAPAESPSFDLHLTGTAQGPQPSEPAVQLVGPNGASHRVTLSALEQGLRVADLEPGTWSAMWGPTLLETKDFTAGEHAWEIQLSQPNQVTVLVQNEDRQPVAGARVFTQESTWGLAQEVATTDVDGRARLARTESSFWLAAALEGGLRAESIHLDESSAFTVISLQLFSHDVHPHYFVLPDAVAPLVYQVLSLIHI